jgi:lanosterol synthase
MHVGRLRDYLWMTKDGLVAGSTNGTQTLDTALCLQAVKEAGLDADEVNHDIIRKALAFLDVAQVRKNPTGYRKCYRHVSKGAWAISTRQQGYIASTSTGEALRAIVPLWNDAWMVSKISEYRLYDAVDVLLTLQDDNGGFGLYEKARAPRWIDWFQPGSGMVERSLVACTFSAVLGLVAFQTQFPDYRASEIKITMDRAITFVKQTQRPNGSWIGNGFVYATMCALECLAAVGETYIGSDHVRRGCDLLLSRQMTDGGWSESNSKSQVLPTSWALLGLMTAKYPNPEPIKRGIQLLMKRQQPNGEWHDTNAFSYPIRALGRYAQLYKNPRLAVQTLDSLWKS